MQQACMSTIEEKKILVEGWKVEPVLKTLWQGGEVSPNPVRGLVVQNNVSGGR
jgi:hypothetical protein